MIINLWIFIMMIVLSLLGIVFLALLAAAIQDIKRKRQSTNRWWEEEE